MKTNISKRLLQYIIENNISYRTIQKYTGMSLSNVNLLKNKEDYVKTISLLTRFLAAFRDEGIIEYIFSDMPDIAEFIFCEPTDKNVLTEADLLLFTISINNFWPEPKMSDHLLNVYFYLTAMAGKANKHQLDINGINMNSLGMFKPGDIKQEFLFDLMMSLYHLPSEEESQSSDYIDAKTYYPRFEDFQNFTEMLKNGETVTWTDIAAIITNARIASGKSAEKLNKELKLASSMIIRMELQRSKSYAIDDICKIDDYLEMNGAFLALCIRASQNSILSSKVFDDFEAEITELKANNFPRVAFINKDDRQKQITHATSSFIQLYRQLEFVPEYAANYYTNPFFREYRSYMKQQEIDNSFLSYVNENKEFFSSKNPLSIYHS